MIDPRVIADITGNGAISALDATRILQKAVLRDVREIPPLPVPPPQSAVRRAAAAAPVDTPAAPTSTSVEATRPAGLDGFVVDYHSLAPSAGDAWGASVPAASAGVGGSLERGLIDWSGRDAAAGTPGGGTPASPVFASLRIREFVLDAGDGDGRHRDGALRVLLADDDAEPLLALSGDWGELAAL